MAKPANVSQSKRHEALYRVIRNASQRERDGVKVNDAAVAVALWIADAGEGALEAHLVYALDEANRPVNARCAAMVYEQRATIFGDTAWDREGADALRRLDGLQRDTRIAGDVEKAIYVAPENINGFLYEFGLPMVQMNELRSLLAEVPATADSAVRLEIMESVCDADCRWNKIDGKPMNNVEYLQVLVGHCSAELKQRLLRAPDTVRLNVMQEAIRQQRTDWVTDMLAHGLSANRAENVFGWRSLQVASNCPDAIRILLAHGADVHGTDLLGNTPLHDAAVNAEVTKLLLDAGADPNRLSSTGHTPLHVMLEQPVIIKGGELAERLKIIHVLLDHGADPFFVPPGASSHYLTPFEYGVKQGLPQQIELVLRRFDVDLAQRTLAGKTLMQLAGKNAETKLLLRAVKTGLLVKTAMVADAPAQQAQAVTKSRTVSPL